MPWVVKTRASSYDEAVSLVNQKICKGDLQTASVEWDDPEYEDDSFITDDIM